MIFYKNSIKNLKKEGKFGNNKNWKGESRARNDKMKRKQLLLKQKKEEHPELYNNKQKRPGHWRDRKKRERHQKGSR